MKIFGTDQLAALAEDEDQPPLVRNLAKCALGQRATLSLTKAETAIDRAERQVRDLTAQIRHLKARIAELESRP